ncbi:non-heme iron oxygenase ferredoxin subunit [Propionivibrio soli]|uniref:non-heme iron oxygenase ferredoxin subunit n=1 Tax=Propionivibrio soli TaxID=2976531 RepID=UPI0021E702F8|nr:non-heme iron oxygenase ferredoxin subunit [Propionivibrio soli]
MDAMNDGGETQEMNDGDNWDDWVDVADVASFRLGTCRTVDLAGTQVAVANVNGRFYAIEDMCSHDAEELSSGEIDGDQIICPRHQARFSLVTGEALTPPAYEPVATFPVRVVEGRVQVRDNRFDE